LIKEIIERALLLYYTHNGDSCQLMQINKKCRWKRFQKVGENQHRGVKGVD
jgi:hypothetical protein